MVTTGLRIVSVEDGTRVRGNLVGIERSVNHHQELLRTSIEACCYWRSAKHVPDRLRQEVISNPSTNPADLWDDNVLCRLILQRHGLVGPTFVIDLPFIARMVWTWRKKMIWRKGKRYGVLNTSFVPSPFQHNVVTTNQVFTRRIINDDSLELYRNLNQYRNEERPLSPWRTWLSRWTQ